MTVKINRSMRLNEIALSTYDTPDKDEMEIVVREAFNKAITEKSVYCMVDIVNVKQAYVVEMWLYSMATTGMRDYLIAADAIKIFKILKARRMLTKIFKTKFNINIVSFSLNPINAHEMNYNDNSIKISFRIEHNETV